MMMTRDTYHALSFNLLTSGYDQFIPDPGEVNKFFHTHCPACHNNVETFDAYRTRYICRVFGTCECGNVLDLSDFRKL